MERKKVVVTGGAGYIGSVLVPLAVLAGYDVHVIDRFFFGSKSLRGSGATLHRYDTRDFPAQILEGTFAVLDLAAISNDPAGELSPETTLDINFRARRRLQELCISAGVQRYVLASSCSVYGFQDFTVNEESATNPLTTYARANLLAEESAFGHEAKGTSFTALRQATVYGLSPRMRFDLVVNAMTLNVYKDGTLRLLRSGEQWRPMVHVQDTSRAFLKVLESPEVAVSGQVFNVGGNSHNFRILELAERVASGLGRPLEIDWYGDPDHRSYQVDFSKIERTLDFRPQWNIEEAAKEIVDALATGATSDGPETITLQWYQELEKWTKLVSEVQLDGRIL